MLSDGVCLCAYIATVLVVNSSSAPSTSTCKITGVADHISMPYVSYISHPYTQFGLMWGGISIASRLPLTMAWH
eukprot:14295-Eustigmatos_ZCMA.PRE.1